MLELSNKARIILAAIILIPVLLYWGISSSPNESLSQGNKVEKEIDYFLTNVTAKEWGSDGKLLRKTDTIRLEHHPNEKASHLEKPINVNYRSDDSQLRITSDTGIALDDNSQTELIDNVVVIDNFDSENSTIMNTSYLTIYPQRNFADTNEHATIVSPNSQLEGVGMDVDFNTRILNLHSRVKGIHKNAE
jgi:lipopolysaccharide export system protein LptC